jgi:hypothetical protein
VPRAKPYPEQTEVDGNSWEDEASTTVEQGEVADKIKPLLARTPNHTQNTQTGTNVEEHTVDEGSAQPTATPARLVITAGNDAGREVDVVPGKAYTIGRGLDNDVVLTDIAVSRKHFDLKAEGASWIIVDRGSGNGTVVNGNVEDNPFALANGDVIEIGNTTFRFDQASNASRAEPAGFDDDDDDDDEMSTVAGKPLREERDEIDALPTPIAPPRNRPKTMPPPVPPRAKLPTAPPFSVPSAQALPPTAISPTLSTQAAFVPTLAPPQMAPALPAPMLAPSAPPNAPTMAPQMLGAPPTLAAAPHSTAPPPMYSQQPLGYGYPQATEMPPHLLQAQPARGPTYVSMPHMGGYAPMLAPQRGRGLDRRTRLAIAGVALALVTGVVTAAIVKTTRSKPAPVAKKETAKPAAGATPNKPTATPIAVAPAPTPQVMPVKPAAAPVPPTPAPPPAPPPESKPEPKVEVKVETPKREPAKVTPRETPKRVVREAPKREPSPAREAPKRVAAATDTSAARDRAEDLYRSKKFGDAASVLTAAARSAGGDDARDLKERAAKLRALQSAYARGTAPAAKSTDAFASLQQAINLDGSVGGNFRSELTDKLRAIAPKAAVSFAAAKDWSKARSAYLAAQSAGSTDSNLPLVKQKLEAYANELYTAAQSEASSNPQGAKDKLKQIRQLVDAKSSIATKAQALYNKL